MDTAILKALYLQQPLSSVIYLPDFIQGQEIQWPKIHRLNNNPQLAEVMKWVPLLFSFKERIAVFRNSLPRIHEGSSVLLKIHRANLIGDTYTEFRSMINSNYQFQQRFQVCSINVIKSRLSSLIKRTIKRVELMVEVFPVNIWLYCYVSSFLKNQAYFWKQRIMNGIQRMLI